MDSFLDKFFIGYLQSSSSRLLTPLMPPPTLSPRTKDTNSSSSSSSNTQGNTGITISISGGTDESVAQKRDSESDIRIAVPVGPPKPTVTRTWAQADDHVIILFHASGIQPSSVSVEVGEALQVRFAHSGGEYQLLLRPHASVEGKAEVSAQSERVRVVLQKHVHAMWPALGEAILDQVECDYIHVYM